MNRLARNSVVQRFVVRRLAGVVALALVSCINFPTPFENIVAGEKIRPFAVVCDPPEAAPGDTVSVRLYYYNPLGNAPSIHWNISLDYGVDLRGSEFEKNVVNLDSMMLFGSTPDTFRFRVPDSVLVHSTLISELVRNPSINPFHLTIDAADSMLRAAAMSGASSPLLTALADNFSCKVKLRAQMRASISIDVTMLLRVRYSNKVHSPNVNKNPTLTWMGIIKVPTAKFTDIDSLATSGYTFQYLYNQAHPDSVRDTVTIDSGYRYFAVADTGDSLKGTRPQTYQYLSYADNAMVLDTERYNFSWFFTNLDYASGMVMDSLIMFGQGRSRGVREVLPPVDTAMHRFSLYCTVRDSRPGDAGATPGEAFGLTEGYFAYTPSYARNTARSSRGGRLF
jgi:hypothetical protein